MLSQNLFSVIIPVFNAEFTLSKTLSSILNQTFPPFEVIVIDDCSNDGTTNIIEIERKKFLSTGINFSYHRLSKNSGPSVARNAGFNLAHGNYVAFIDSDDEWISEKLEIVGEVLAKCSCDLVFHKYSEIKLISNNIYGEKHSYRVKKILTWQLLIRNPCQTSCAIVRRSLDIRFDESMRYCEDYDLWLRMLANNNKAIMLEGPPLTVLGRPQGSLGGLSGNRFKMRRGEFKAYYKFSSKSWILKISLFPVLIVFSLLKHSASIFKYWITTYFYRLNKTTK